MQTIIQNFEFEFEILTSKILTYLYTQLKLMFSLQEKIHFTILYRRIIYSAIKFKEVLNSILILSTDREASVSPGSVTTGVPVHRMSILVVWPLHNGVSRHTSANCPRLTCSSFAATFENIMRPGGKPITKHIGQSPNQCKYIN